MKKWVIFGFLLGLGFPGAEAKVDKDKCQKLAKKFKCIGSATEPGEEAQRLNDFFQAAQSGPEKEKDKNKTQFCSMYFAQMSFVEANYKYMQEEKCDSFEQYNIPWRTAIDHLQNRYKSPSEILCAGGNKPGFGSSKAFRAAHENYLAYYQKMLGENQAIEKSYFKFW